MSGPGFLARAVALHLAGKRDEALKQLQRAIAANEASPEIYRAMGHIQFELGDHKEAAKSYRALTQIKPQYAMGWFNLAVCLERLGSWEEAAEAFGKASTLEPGHLDAHLCPIIHGAQASLWKNSQESIPPWQLKLASHLEGTLLKFSPVSGVMKSISCIGK